MIVLLASWQGSERVKPVQAEKQAWDIACIWFGSFSLYPSFCAVLVVKLQLATKDAIFDCVRRFWAGQKGCKTIFTSVAKNLSRLFPIAFVQNSGKIPHFQLLWAIEENRAFQCVLKFTQYLLCLHFTVFVENPNSRMLLRYDFLIWNKRTFWRSSGWHLCCIDYIFQHFSLVTSWRGMMDIWIRWKGIITYIICDPRRPGRFWRVLQMMFTSLRDWTLLSCLQSFHTLAAVTHLLKVAVAHEYPSDGRKILWWHCFRAQMWRTVLPFFALKLSSVGTLFIFM